MITIATCLLIAVMLPNLIAFGSLRYRIAQFGRPDIKNPRAQGEKLTGAGERTTAAQKNAWEALATYSAALVIGFGAQVPVATLALGSTIFIVARIIHPIAYIGNVALLRVVCWITAFGACVWMIVQAL